MKIIFSFLFTLFLGSQALAAGDFGLGFMIGSPTGISGNYRMSSNTSLDGALAYNFDGASELYLHTTYLTHKVNGLRLDGKVIDWYYGLGGRFINIEKDKDNRRDERKLETHLGVRGSLGINIPLNDRKFDVFGEVAFVGNVIPKTYVDFNLGLGGRFYF